MRRRLRIVLLSTLLLVTPGASAGCSGCAAALIPGVLVAQGSELALKEDATGVIRPIRWPFGYDIRAGDAGLVLTDLLGNVKAREGDHVQLPGGELSSDGPWGVCGELKVDG